MRITRPLIEIDPGWLFVVAGLVLCVLGVLIPAQRDLHQLKMQHEQLAQREGIGRDRLLAHARFLTDVRNPDEALIRRLAAWQLNLAPRGDTSVILAASENTPVTAWIDARVTTPVHTPKPWPQTTLTDLAVGPKRLWLLGGGVLAVFVGLMLSPARRTATDLPQATLEHKEHHIMIRAIDKESAETADSVDLHVEEAWDDPEVCEVVTRRGFLMPVDQRCAAD